ncbi:hypothetical protein ACF0H5_006048 [Mactra antiquata]
MENKRQKAVIGGIAARLANSSNLQELWDNLFNEKGEDKVLPSARWLKGLYDRPDGHIPNLDKFDNEYFNIPAEEVNHMNPIFRQMLEVVYECIVDSCLPLQEFQVTSTGVYIACSSSDTNGNESSRHFNSTYNTTMEHLATELTLWYGLTGPSITMNSSKVSSMTALKCAVEDLLLERCNYAIVIGCDVVLNPPVTEQLDLLDSHCLRSEGCMAVLLARKPEDLPRVYCNLIDIGIHHVTDFTDDTDNPQACDIIYKILDSIDGIGEDELLYINSQGIYAKIPVTEDHIESDPKFNGDSEVQTSEGSQSKCDDGYSKSEQGRSRSDEGHQSKSDKDQSKPNDGGQSKSDGVQQSKSDEDQSKSHESHQSKSDKGQSKTEEEHHLAMSDGNNSDVDNKKDLKVDERSKGRGHPFRCEDGGKVKVENSLLTSNLYKLIGCPKSLTGMLNCITCLLAYQNNAPPNDEIFREKFAEKVREDHKKRNGMDDEKEKSTLEKYPFRMLEVGNDDGADFSDKEEEDGTQYYMVIEPYVSENINCENASDFGDGDIFLPFTVRNMEGVSTLKEFVQSHQCNVPLLGLLSQSMLSCDEDQPIRGYMYADISNYELKAYHDPCNSCLDSLYLCLNDFMFNYVTMETDLYQLGCFYIALEQCQKSIHLLEPRLDIMSILEKGEPLSPCTKVGILSAAALCISLIDTLETFSIEFDGSIGCGLSEIIAAYMDGCITRDQCFMIYSVIGEHLEQFSQKHGDKWYIYDVDIEYSEVYQLGPCVQVLVIHDKLHVTVAIEEQTCDQILDKILFKGGSYEKCHIDIPVYSIYMKGIAQSVYEQLLDIIPSPVRRSHHLVSARTDWNQSGIQQQVLYDAEYISQLICQPVNLFEARTVLPPDCIILSLNPSHITEMNRSLEEEPVVKKGLQISMTSPCNESKVNESMSRSLLEVPDHITCVTSLSSVLHAVGKLHIHGIPVNATFLYDDEISDWPVGIEVPSISPLVTWNHLYTWKLPYWLEFSAANERPPYVMEMTDDDHRPVAVVLYHIWQAISKLSDKVDSPCSIRLYNITCMDTSILHGSDLNGTCIYVLSQSETFCLILEDEILLRGKFDIQTQVDLPVVPGYDLDVNENIDQSSSSLNESTYEKTHVQWDDAWLDFMDKLLEFSEENLGILPSEVLVNVDYHLQETKECCNFLAVAENVTGLCRAGGLVYRFKDPYVIDKIDPKKTCITITSQAVAQHLMVYSLTGFKNNKILLFNGTKESNKHPMVGMVKFSGEAELIESDVAYDFDHEHLETIIPYILAVNVVFNVAMVTEKQHIAILPPLDTVSMYMIVLCLNRGCHVYTSTCDLETKQFLEEIFPSLNVLHDNDLYKEIMCKTLGDGVDACIRVSGGDMQKLLRYIGKNGLAIQCSVPDENSKYFELSNHGRNRVIIVDSSQAICNFIKNTSSNFQDLTVGMKNEFISKLHEEGFPEFMGMLYKQEVDIKLDKPVCVNYLLQQLTDVHTGSYTDNLSQHDASCITKIQNLVSPKPLDVSVTDTKCLFDNTVKSTELYEDNTLNTGMISSPSGINCLSPDVNVIIFSDSFAETKLSSTSGSMKFGTDRPMHSSSTPLVYDPELFVQKKLEESYLGDDCTETSFHIYNDSMRDEPDDIERPDDIEKPSELEKHDGLKGTGVIEKSDDHEKHKDAEKPKDEEVETCESSENALKVDKAERDDKKDGNFGMIIDGNKKMTEGDRILRKEREVFDTPSQTNRVLIEDESTQQHDGHSGRRTSKEGMNKRAMLNEHSEKTSNDSVMISEVLANRSVLGLHDRSFNKRLSSLGFDRPSTPIAKSKDGDLPRHRMLQKRCLVPPKLPLPKMKIDLLVFGRPMTPNTPDLQEVLSPKMSPNVVPLNCVDNPNIPPLFIVHTISGCTSMFQNLTKQLDFQCYGLQMTGSTPTGSITEMARYYKEVIVMKQMNGPYRIAGHSYSTILALEIAVCLQSEGKQVDYLIMLDGSPSFTQQQINQGLKHLSSKSSKSEIDEALSIGSLISWIEHYGNVQNKLLTYGLLKKIPSLDGKIDTAVDISFGTTIISCCPIKTRWLTAKQRLLQMLRYADWKTERLADAAREIIRLKRRQRAVEFMKQMQLAYTYQMTTAFTGDINLFRVKQVSGIDVPHDYGLQTMCSGKVLVKHYQTTPDKFIASEAFGPLADDLNVVLKCPESLNIK